MPRPPSIGSLILNGGRAFALPTLATQHPSSPANRSGRMAAPTSEPVFLTSVIESRSLGILDTRTRAV
jgi:hypothetical protein